MRIKLVSVVGEFLWSGKVLSCWSLISTVRAVTPISIFFA